MISGGVTADVSVDLSNKVKTHRNVIDQYTDGLKVEVRFYADDDDIGERDPIATRTVDYGGTVKLYDVPVPPNDDDDDDEFFIGWEVMEGDDVIWKSGMPAFCNIHLAPEYGDLIRDKPTAADFNRNPSSDIVWEDDRTGRGDLDDMDDMIEWALLQGNPNRTIHIVVEEDGRELYRWSITSNGLETEKGEIRITIEKTDAPDHVRTKITEGKITYLDFKASRKMPHKTVVKYNVEGTYSDGTVLDVYHDDGADVQYLGTTTVIDGTADINVEECSGYVLVATEGGSGDGGLGDNTMLIVDAVVVVIVVAAAGVFLMRRNA